LKLGIEVAQSTVAKYMAKRRPGSGQTWKTFLCNHVAGISAMDFLVVPTINFRLLFVLVILRHERRRLISLSVTNHQTAEWIHRDLRRRSVMSRYAPARLEMPAEKLGQPPARSPSPCGVVRPRIGPQVQMRGRPKIRRAHTVFAWSIPRRASP
jgi:hypothetical protein